jgi:hypothetical protein
MRRPVPLFLAVAQLACATAPVATEAPTELPGAGSIQRGSLGASFDGTHVLNPSISLARHADGSWSGSFSLAGTGSTIPLDVSVGKDAIRGVGFVLVRSTPEPGRTVYDGTFDGKRFHFELSEAEVRVKTARYEGTYTAPSRDGDALRFHAGGELVLTGAATAISAPPWPHLALALVAAFY